MMLDFKCPACGRVSEHFFHATESATVGQCPCECGQMASRSREITRAPAVVWTGPLDHRYRNKESDGYHNSPGQWAYTRRGPGGEPIAPKAVRLEDWQQVKTFAKQNGCYDPRDLPKTLEVGEDGKSVSSSGFSGQEI